MFFMFRVKGDKRPEIDFVKTNAIIGDNKARYLRLVLHTREQLCIVIDNPHLNAAIL